MSTKIGVLYYNDITRESFNDIINTHCGCMRCGHQHNYTENKLPRYLNQLQKLSGKYKLPYPDKLYYEFSVVHSENVTKTKGFFKKEEYTENVETGCGAMVLFFNEDLTPEDNERWTLVVAGLFAAVKSLD